MYCKNCGNELGENENFCGKCGTGVNQTESEAGNKIKSLSLDKIKNIKLDNPLAKTFLITAILHLVMIVLRFVSFGEYSISVKELPVIGKSGAITLNEIWDSSIETTIFIIGMLISVFLCILPIIKGDYEKRRRMVFPKIALFWNTFIVVFAIWELSDWVQSNKESIAYNYGEESLKYFSGSWSLTFGGWLAVIVTLAIIVMLFRISRKTR